MSQSKYRSHKGWYKAIILPHGEVNRLYKYRANTVSGWEILFWSACADTEQARADFEQHHEPLKDLAFETEGIPFSELPGNHYFSFVLPDYVSDYSYLKQTDGTVKPLVIPPPNFSDSTIVQDMGGTL